MGLFSQFKKRNLVDELGSIYVFKSKSCSNEFVRKFVYASIICTERFFGNFITNGQKFPYLLKYKDIILSGKSIRNTFKLFAMHDFKTYMAKLSASGYKLENEIDYEKSIHLIFDFTEEDEQFDKFLKTIKAENFVVAFHSFLLKQVLNKQVDIEKDEIDWMRSILLDRLFEFSQTIMD